MCVEGIVNELSDQRLTKCVAMECDEDLHQLNFVNAGYSAIQRFGCIEAIMSICEHICRLVSVRSWRSPQTGIVGADQQELIEEVIIPLQGQDRISVELGSMALMMFMLSIGRAPTLSGSHSRSYGRGLMHIAPSAKTDFWVRRAYLHLLLTSSVQLCDTASQLQVSFESSYTRHKMTLFPGVAFITGSASGEPLSFRNSKLSSAELTGAMKASDKQLPFLSFEKAVEKLP